MRKYLSVAILLIPSCLFAQSDASTSFSEDDIQLYVMLHSRYEIVHGEVGRKEGAIEIKSVSRESLFPDLSSQKQVKSFKAKTADAVTREMFAYMEKVQEGNANFQYDFVFKKTSEGFLIQLYT